MYWRKLDPACILYIQNILRSSPIIKLTWEARYRSCRARWWTARCWCWPASTWTWTWAGYRRAAAGPPPPPSHPLYTNQQIQTLAGIFLNYSINKLLRQPLLVSFIYMQFKWCLYIFNLIVIFKISFGTILLDLALLTRCLADTGGGGFLDNSSLAIFSFSASLHRR